MEDMIPTSSLQLSLIAGAGLGLIGRLVFRRPWWSIALLVPIVIAAGFAIIGTIDGAPVTDAGFWKFIAFLGLLALPMTILGIAAGALIRRSGARMLRSATQSDRN